MSQDGKNPELPSPRGTCGSKSLDASHDRAKGPAGQLCEFARLVECIVAREEYVRPRLKGTDAGGTAGITKFPLGQATFAPVDMWDNIWPRSETTRLDRRHNVVATRGQGGRMQTIWITTGNVNEELSIPSSTEEVVEGVRWGTVDQFFTPAFWKCQAELHSRRNEYTSHRLGCDLREELAVCLLGGYGIPAEMGMLAFKRLRLAGMLDGAATEADIAKELARPFQIGGREVKYRFHSQKASYLHRALSGMTELDVDCGDVDLRNALMGLPGIGPKTASWIVRNHRGSNDVAIIDVHLHRAGQMMQLFDEGSEPTRHYFDLESRFLSFCKAIRVAASVLDALIWDYMRRVGPTAKSARLSPLRAAEHQLSFAI